MRLLSLLCCLMLLGSCSSGPQKESTGEYLDSSAITAKVKAKLLQDERVSVLDVKVKTFKSVVQLSGFVTTEEEKIAAGRLAAQVDGVAEVKNDLIVKKAN